MDHISNASESQENIHIQSKIDDFFDRFKIGTLLHRCGVHKRHGHGVRSLTQAIFTLPFVGKNFFRGIVSNRELPFGKDAAYELLKGTTYNWPKYKDYFHIPYKRQKLRYGISIFMYL